MDKEKLLAIDDLTLYHALMELGIISEEQLDSLIDGQKKLPNTSLAQMLLQTKTLTPDLVKQIMDHSQNTTRLEGKLTRSGEKPSLIEEPAQLVGQLVGKYEIGRLVARGGMGFVYEGFDPTLKRKVAIKMLSPSLSKNMEYRQRFIREARLLAQIEHPNVVAIYDFGESHTTLYLASKYIEGGNLEEVVQIKGPLPWQTVVEYLLHVVAALEEAHKRAIVHRDIKPANIMLHSDGRVILTDFGIAYIDQSDLTQSGKSLGTPLYMAPELLEGKPVDFRCDIYALGITTYFLLSGTNPFACDTPFEIIHRQLQGEFTPIDKVVSLPKEMHQLVSYMMERQPENRPRDMGEIRLALERLAKKAGKTGHFSFGNFWPKAKNLARDKRILLSLSVGILIVLLWLIFPHSSTKPPSQVPSSKEVGLLRQVSQQANDLADRGKVEKGLELLESIKQNLSPQLLSLWQKKYHQLEIDRQDWLDRFKLVDQRGQKALKKKRILTAKRIYSPFQKVDIPQIKAVIRSRFLEIHQLKQDKILSLEKTGEELLKREKLREALALYKSFSSEGSREKVKKAFHSFFQKAMKKVEGFFQQRLYTKVLKWYNLLRKVEDPALSAKAREYFQSFRKKITQDLDSFLMGYNLSAKEEGRGNYREALEDLAPYLRKTSPFRHIAQERIQAIQKMVLSLPKDAKLVYGVYESYIGQLRISGNHFYFLPAKEKEKFLTDFDVGDSLGMLVRGKKVLKIWKDGRGAFFEEANTWKKKRPVICTLKSRTIRGFYLAHSPSGILIAEHVEELLPQVIRLDWDDIQKIK